MNLIIREVKEALRLGNNQAAVLFLAHRVAELAEAVKDLVEAVEARGGPVPRPQPTHGAGERDPEFFG